MNDSASLLLRFGPFLFYFIEFGLWLLASLGVMAGVDIRKPLGILGVLAVPLFGLFILASIIAHTIFLIRRQFTYMLPLFLANVIGIIGYWVLVFIVLTWAEYR